MSEEKTNEQIADVLGTRIAELYDVCEAHEADKMLAQALSEAEARGFRRGVEEAAKIIEDTYAPAYHEDFFTPVPKYGDQTDEQSRLITRASFQMGNHLCKVMIRDIRALIPGSGEEKQG